MTAVRWGSSRAAAVKPPAGPRPQLLSASPPRTSPAGLCGLMTPDLPRTRAVVPAAESPERTFWSTPAGYASVFGATRRVADQSLLTEAVVVWARPAIGAASAMSAGSTALLRPTFGVS